MASMVSPPENRLSSKLYGRKPVPETPPIKLSNFIYPSTPLYRPFKHLHRTDAKISRKRRFSHTQVTQEICGLTSKLWEGLCVFCVLSRPGKKTCVLRIRLFAFYFCNLQLPAVGAATSNETSVIVVKPSRHSRP